MRRSSPGALCISLLPGDRALRLRNHGEGDLSRQILGSPSEESPEESPGEETLAEDGPTVSLQGWEELKEVKFILKQVLE